MTKEGQLVTGGPHFGSDELRSVQAGLQEFEADQVTFGHPALVVDRLRHLWEPDWIPPAYKLAEPEWYLGMTDEFLKAIQDIDRKLQGRILKAIGLIVRNPTAPKGNTVQPLTGDLKGLWRYRIGKYRLVYLPDTGSRRVVLISFTSRGDAYA